MGITAFYGKPMADSDAISLLRHAADLGATHWDTAEVYQCKDDNGDTVYNETVVGKAIKAVGRDKITVASKYQPFLHGNELTPALAIEAARASCDRLGISRMDLYYVHRFATKSSIEEQAEAMSAVQAAGLAKHIGVSEFNCANIRKFHAICPITCVQQEWSLMNRDLEEDIVPTCRELGIGIVAYSPLCRKLLSGEVRSAEDLPPEDMRTSRYGRFVGENLVKNAMLVQEVKDMAKDKGVTAAQLSLAWVCNQGDDVVPIPGTTSMKHLEDNMAAANIVLDKKEMAVIASAVPQDKVAGDRYANDGNKNAFTYKDGQ